MAILEEDGTLICANKAWDKLEIIYDTDNQQVDHKELISKIKQLFNDKGFVTSSTHALAHAAWHPKIFRTATGQHYDVGIYGIQMEKRVFQVLVLRPTMDSAITPYWHAEMKKATF